MRSIQVPPSLVVEPVPPGTHRPFWSVMIPTYNCADYLVATLKSVLQQAPPPEEMQIAVIDDCSTKDDPEQVVKDIGKGRVEFYRQPKNSGAILTFNACVRKSRGYWVHVLHGDDYVLPGFYEHLRVGCEYASDIGSAHCRSAYVDEKGAWTAVSFVHRQTAGVNIHFTYHQGVINRLMTPSIVVKREAYENIGCFDPRYPHSADWDMWNRVGRHYRVWFEPKVLACYREHTSSDTSKLKRTGANIRDGHQYIRNQYSHLPPAEASELTRMALKEHANYANWIADRMLAMGDLDAALAQLQEGLNCTYVPLLAQKQQKIQRLQKYKLEDFAKIEPLQTVHPLEYYQNLVKANPEDASIHLKLSKIYSDRGELDAALDCGKKALRLNPDAAAYKGLGDVMYKMRKLEAALYFYNQSRELDDDRSEVHEALGDLQIDRGQWQQALECYIRALSLQPNSARVYWNLHRVWQQLDRYKESVTCLYRAFVLEPQLATQDRDYLELGNNLFALDKLDEAIACYQQALRMNPNLAEAYNYLGHALTKQEKLEEAQACYRTATELDPHLSVA